MKKLTVSILITVILSTLLLGSCSKKYPQMNNSTDIGTSSSHTEMNMQDSSKAPDPTNASYSGTNRKVIKRLQFSLQTKDYEKTIENLNNFISKVNGYIESSSQNGSLEDMNINAQYVVKIPSDSIDDFKTEVKTFGNITYTAEGGEDITSQYYDTDARLRMLKIQETRLLDLLSKSDNIQDLLAVESELNRIRTEIERLETTIKGYDNLVDFSTVTLNIRLTDNYTNNSGSFLDEIAESFRDAIEYGINMLRSFILWMVWISPFLFILGIIAVIVIVIIKKQQKKLSEKTKKINDENLSSNK